MSEEEVRQIIQEELDRRLEAFMVVDKYTFQKHIQVFDGRNIQTGKTTGTIIGTGTDQKIGFYDTTPVVQPSSAGETSGHSVGAATAVTEDSTFTGNTGTIAYTISDIVKHLKALGLIDS